jgi:hypothetical protein
MVESADTRKRNDVAVLRRLDLASSRRVSGERHVRSVLVVELRVLTSAPQ